MNRLTAPRYAAAVARNQMLRMFLLALLAAGFAGLGRAQSVTLTNLHVFSVGDGQHPEAAVVQASDGNFYGTAYSGGANNEGVVFQLTPAGNFTLLHEFNGANPGSQDGEFPYDSLVQGTDGNLYGTTQQGGVHGGGVVFKITTGGAYTNLYSFTGAGDGAGPLAALVQGGDGNFYGTTESGANFFRGNSEGTVFQMTPAGVLTTLYAFTGGVDGGQSVAPLIQGTDGNFYGTTTRGGVSGGDANGQVFGNGTVFKITPAGVLTTLYRFTAGADGAVPLGGVIQGKDGNFYGTTSQGGAGNYGTVFKLTPAGALTTLYAFTDGADGGTPEAGLVQAASGNLYGTTYNGGTAAAGTIFGITTSGGFASIYSFNQGGSGADGVEPAAYLIQGTDGNLYGTTTTLGSVPGSYGSGVGTVFRLMAAEPPAFFNGEASLGSDVYYLAFPNGNIFGYYNVQYYPTLYHYDLGFEYVIDAKDGVGGVFLYDFTSGHFWYTSPVFPFPYLYDFGLSAFLYYIPATNNPGHYTSNPRYFSNLTTGMIITQ